MTEDELKAFCDRHDITGPMATSASTGEGVPELIERMKSMIPWEDKPATVTTQTFKRIKDYVLGLKEKSEDASDGQRIVTSEELRQLLEATDSNWQFSDDEMLTAVGHLENYGYVRRLRTSKGEQRILLEMELVFTVLGCVGLLRHLLRANYPLMVWLLFAVLAAFAVAWAIFLAVRMLRPQEA